ncbi:unnamed protein product [Prunus armeniaca]
MEHAVPWSNLVWAGADAIQAWCKSWARRECVEELGSKQWLRGAGPCALRDCAGHADHASGVWARRRWAAQRGPAPSRRALHTGAGGPGQAGVGPHVCWAGAADGLLTLGCFNIFSFSASFCFIC